jgi:hypothetical protein
VALVAQEAVPIKGPVKLPEKDPVSWIPLPPLASMAPDPLITLVVRLDAPPPITACPDAKLSTCKLARFAELPETMTFFQTAIPLNFSYFYCNKYMFFV